MARKILFSDYDGTIYAGADSIAKNITAIKTFRAAGNKFVVTTGRSLASMQRLFDKHHVPYDYLILNNGAVVTDEQNNLLLKQFLSPQLAEQLTSFINENIKTDISIIYYDLTDRAAYFEKDLTKLRVRVTGKAHAPAIKIAKKINQHFGDQVKALAAFNDPYPEENWTMVDVVHKQAGKDTAIEFILDHENLSKTDATSVGDGPNDIAMLHLLNGYALENSAPIVLKEVKQTTPSVADLISNMLK